MMNQENKEMNALKKELKSEKAKNKRLQKENTKKDKALLYCTRNNNTATLVYGLEMLIRDKGPGHHELPEELHDILAIKKRLDKTTTKND